MHLKNHMKVVLVNIDDGLIDTTKSILHYLNCLHNSNVKYYDLKEKNFLKYFPEIKDQEELEQIIAEERILVKAERTPYAKAFAAIIRQGQQQTYTLHTISDRFYCEERGWKTVRKDTENHLRSQGIKSDKTIISSSMTRKSILSTYMYANNLVLYVDDNIRNLQLCCDFDKELPILRLIDRPWNRDVNLKLYGGKIKRVKNLGEFLK